MNLIEKWKNSVQNSGVIGTAAIAVCIINLDSSVVNVIFPKLSNIFHVNPDTVSLAGMTYLMAMGASLPFFGRLADRIGVERVFTGGYLLFGLGSLLCGFANTLMQLSLFRAIQGIGAGMLIATSAAIIVEYLPTNMRAKAFGINGIMMSFGLAAGPPLGAWLTDRISWRTVFFINIPFVLIGIILCLKNFKRPKNEYTLKGFDFIGAVLAILILIAATLIFSSADIDMLDKAKSIAYWAIIPLLGIFFVIENRTKDPILDLTLLKNRPLSFALAGNFAYLFMYMGLSFVLPFFIIHSMKYSLPATGHTLMILPMASLAVMPFVSKSCSKLGIKSTAIIGISAMAMALIGLYFVIAENSNFNHLLVYSTLSLLGMGLGFFSIAILTLIMTHAKTGNTGMLSALKAVVPLIGGLAGIGLFSDTFTSVLDKLGVNIHNASTGNVNEAFKIILGLSIICIVFTFIATICSRENKEA